MHVQTHRKTDTGYALTLEVEATEEQAQALASLGEQTAGEPTTYEDGVARVSFVYGPAPVDPETGKAAVTEKEYAESQAREAALLIQSALDSSGGGKGKKLATEGTTVEV
jgi:hypothetical protein